MIFTQCQFKVIMYLLTIIILLCYNFFIMKKGVILFSLIGLLIAPVCMAYSVSFDPGGILGGAGLQSADPADIIFTIINVVLAFLGVITLILVIYGGFIWMMAGGNEENVTKAKKILRGAVIGLAIVLASYSVSQYVFNQLASVTT